jgi:rubrerythrin
VKEVHENRTGIAARNDMVEEMKRDAAEGTRDARPDKRAVVEQRSSYAEDDPHVGSMPPPNGMRGKAKDLAQRLKGADPVMLLDKLGERLAFERTGARLYEAVIDKARSRDGDDDDMDTDELLGRLRRIHAEELEHFHLVARCIRELGGDPTAVTPSADLAGVSSSGLLKVANDVRTTVPQALEALLMAELIDNAAWELLVRLAEQAGRDEMRAEFFRAMEEEEEHLRIVKGWVEEHVLST